MAYAVFSNQFGHHVMKVDQGKAELIITCGADLPLAERVRDLLDRHGLVDVPLAQVETS